MTESEAWDQLSTIELNRAKLQLDEAKNDADNAVKVYDNILQAIYLLASKRKFLGIKISKVTLQGWLFI